jgi:hypothetical protein
MDALFETPASEGTVLAVLFEQHGRIRESLSDVRSASGDARAETFYALVRLLAAHETAEEIVLRPVSVQIMDRDAVADRNHEERRIVELLTDLEKLDELAGPAFDALFGPLEQAVAEHLTMEETTEFPAIESDVDEKELLTMGRWIRHALALGPTRPHLVPAGHPVAERVSLPFTALADHAKDLFERTREE